MEQVLIHWSNILPEEATWENYATIVTKYPDFISLEDKVVVKEESM